MGTAYSSLGRKKFCMQLLKFLKCVDPNPYCQRWLCQGILLTERFPKFSCEGSNQRVSVCDADAESLS